MTQEQNIFLAKRNLVDYVYRSAKLEGCNVTFPETQTILDGVNVGSVTLDDLQTVLNLRDGWRFVCGSIGETFDLTYLCKINECISRNESLAWGVLRSGHIGISGTDYRPPVPLADEVVERLAKFEATSNATERAIAVFLWLCRSQLFWDGNKRTAVLSANKILMAAGEGILTIRQEHILAFNERLLAWYNTGDPAVLDQWLYDHAIEGIEF